MLHHITYYIVLHIFKLFNEFIAKRLFASVMTVQGLRCRGNAITQSVAN